MVLTDEKCTAAAAKIGSGLLRTSNRARAGIVSDWGGIYRKSEQHKAIEGRLHEPATSRVDARGVASRSPTSDEWRGGELMRIPLLASCEGGAGVARAGDEWKEKGEEDATAGAPLGARLELLGVVWDCWAGVED